MPPQGEANVLEHLKQEGPGHHIKGLGKVDLEQHCGAAAGMQPTAGKLHRSEILVDSPAADECRLVRPDDIRHTGDQAES
jgi:hypothetical protein